MITLFCSTKVIYCALLYILMADVVVVHSWNDDQKDKVMEFANKVTTMAKNKQLPKGLKLLGIDLGQGQNMAVCKWEADSLNHLMEVAKSLGPTWDIKAFEVKPAYKHGLF
jgi:hypothetical protein